MATYYVDDGGDGSDGSTWAKAYTSLSALDDAVALASGDIVYIGHDHVCQYTHTANRTITGPTSGKPTIIISATQGSDPPAYQAGTANQIDTSEGAYALTFDGAFALYGLRIKAGTIIVLQPDLDESVIANSCYFLPGNNAAVELRGRSECVDCTYDLSQDTAGASSGVLSSGSSNSWAYFRGGSVINCSNRNSLCFYGISSITAHGLDISAWPTTVTIARALYGESFYSNIKTPATFALSDQTYQAGFLTATNFGPADNPAYVSRMGHGGTLLSYTTIYRTGGASMEGNSSSWLITTHASCAEGSYFHTAWVYGYISAAGSKTFDVYITNDTADFTDAEVWLEVEYLGTADVGKTTLASDKRATITTTAVAQTDDTTSTWVGTGPAFTYKQKLSVTATVGEEGQFRARVCVGVASISAARNFFIDPKVTVS